MIELCNVTKKYGDKYAARDVSFSVKEGEIMGFLGPNGAGKSTTMNIITGYLSATGGKAMIDGVDILDDPVAVKKKIGFLPEQPPLYMDMTVKEYLNFVYDLKGCRLNRKAHIAEICEVVKIVDVYKRKIKNLSKGYRQRVGIAQALVGNPPVLIFDEPTVGLDPQQIIDIRNLIKKLGKKHTIILSTHILPEVQAVCDRIVVINDGVIVADCKTDEIYTVVTGTRKYKATISGPEKQVLSLLRSVDGIMAAEVLSGEGDDAAYMIECDVSIDVRKPLFYKLAEKSWPLMGLEILGASLEDVFLRLVEKKGGKK